VTGAERPHADRSHPHAARLRLRPAYPLDMRRPLVVAALTASLLLALAGPAAAAAPFKATLKAPTHNPKANALWRITVTARSNSGKALRATADYQFLLRGQVVARSHPSPNADPRSACAKAGNCRHAPWPFRGRYRDTLIWPARSAGIDLTFRVVVKVKGLGTRNLDYSVRVRR
jgi:hypothetical protein